MRSPASPAPLLAYFTGFFYILFTLIPDSHSLMVAWSWVFVWQIGLFCPLLWLLVQIWDHRRIFLLGNRFDIFVGITLLGLGISTLGAEFPQQARWYAWASLGFLATLYPLNRWLNQTTARYRVFLGQGYLSLAFVAFSLALWFSQTFLPEQSRIEELGREGLNIEFNFAMLGLRNWAPLGHQNYVAGYLILCLPILLGLTILHRDWRRWLWLTGVVIGGVDLYTTSSRGGWLGLAIAALTAFCFAWNFSTIRKRRLVMVGGLTLSILLLFVLTNNRLNTLVTPILLGKGLDEFNYRWINAQVGWQMGLSHPFTGAGLGNVPMLYQQFRPISAGRLSEIIYQLHSTPVQLWAEMGIWGIGLFVGSLIFLGWLLWRLRPDIPAMPREDRILLGSIYTALVGYWALSLTDYQLDNVCISGIIVILLALLSAIARRGTPQQSIPAQVNIPQRPFGKVRIVALGLLGLYGAIGLWLIPIHQAWEKSSNGFNALEQNKPDYDRFVEYLTEAHQYAPWEPYYPYQLGWNLGELALKTADDSQRQRYFKEAIAWFKQGNQISPYQEFGHTNLAWLYLARDNHLAATKEFVQSVQLIPAKRGVFYGLGLSLLGQNQFQPAVEAIALEVLRDPQFITSPIWRRGQLFQLYPTVVNRVMEKLDLLIQQFPDDAYLHRLRGGMAWWIEDYALAETELDQYGSLSVQNLLRGEGNPESTTEIALLRQAWDDPDQRSTHLEQAWLRKTQKPIEAKLLQDFLLSMQAAPTFDQWLREYAPEWQYRRQRSGFNVISRHIEGLNPTDFWTVSENVAIVTWFGNVLPSMVYSPDFDRQLQPLREKLLAQL